MGLFEKLVTLKWGGGGGGLANADVIKEGLNADRGEGVKFAKILLTSYVNAPLPLVTTHC